MCSERCSIHIFILPIWFRGRDSMREAVCDNMIVHLVSHVFHLRCFADFWLNILRGRMCKCCFTCICLMVVCAQPLAFDSSAPPPARPSGVVLAFAWCHDFECYLKVVQNRCCSTCNFLLPFWFHGRDSARAAACDEPDGASCLAGFPCSLLAVFRSNVTVIISCNCCFIYCRVVESKNTHLHVQ